MAAGRKSNQYSTKPCHLTCGSQVGCCSKYFCIFFLNLYAAQLHISKASNALRHDLILPYSKELNLWLTDEEHVRFKNLTWNQQVGASWTMIMEVFFPTCVFHHQICFCFFSNIRCCFPNVCCLLLMGSRSQENRDPNYITDVTLA